MAASGKPTDIKMSTLPTGQKLQDRLNNYVLEKLARWAITEQVDEGKPSWFRWNAEDKKLLSQIMADPEKAGFHLDASDTKYKKFFQSIIDNGFNTADAQLFQRYRDQLPLRALNWVFDLRDFKHNQSSLRSSVALPAGFYMVELQIRPNQFSSRIPIHIHRSSEKLTTPKAFDQVMGTEDDFSMPVISHRINKRLIWLRSPGFVDVTSDHGESIKSITNLRLARATQSFMIDRMMKKLGQTFDLNVHIKMSASELEKIWQTYDDRFGYEYDPVAAYQRFLAGSTQTTNPVDRNSQLADLTKWLKR